MRFTKKGFVCLSSIMLVLMFMLSSISVFATGNNTWTNRASMAIARAEYEVAVIDGKVYAIGGCNSSSSFLNSIEEYNPSTNKWIAKATMPTARRYHQVAVVGGKIYVIGGYNNSRYLNSVEEYDPATNTWMTKATMPTARSWHQVAVVGGKIYAIGGENDTGIINSVVEYDPVRNTWTTKASMPTARRYHQVAVVGGKIYAIGGYNSSSYLNSVEAYDPANNTWTSKAPMTTARGNHQVAVVRGKIYAIGGYSASGRLSSVEEYDPTSNIWALKKPMSTLRLDHQVAVVGDKIYAMGGGNDNIILNSVEEYDPATNTWITKAPMATARFYHRIAVVGGKIYAIGGRDGNNYHNSVEEYDTGYSFLQPPTNLIASVDKTKVDLSWTGVEDATSYNVKRSQTPGGPYEIIQSNLTETTYTDTEVTNGTTYYYVVSALNESGESENSNEVYATPEQPTVTLEVTSVDKAKLGDEITANIVIHNATNICAEDLKIAYDTSKLQFLSAENADGMKIYKEDDIAAGIKRYITACLGKANAANGDKILLKMKFKAIDKGEAKIDITNGRIADNATLEMDVSQENCGEKTILIEGVKDVNRTGEYTLLDLGIDAWYYGDAAADTDTSKYDADQIVNGTIDDDDLTEIVTQILANNNYTANK